jgi:hypothetical protein
LLIVAAEVAEEAHVTEAVKFWVLPSVNVPVAANCCLLPTAADGFAGVIASDNKAGDVTLRTVEPLIPADVAEMADVPGARLVDKPWLPTELLIVATPVLAEAQIAVLVRSWVEPSE